jgi:predicted dehydrogenase
MLEDTELDAIDVAASRDAHASLCRMAEQKGLSILCQKPLAPTLAEAESLVYDLARLGRSRLMVHENWRFRPHYRQISSWIAEGHVGEVRTVVMQVFTSGLLPDATGALPALVRQPMLAGLDRMLLMEVLIHHVDTLSFLIGALELKGARLGRSCAAIRGEDSAMLFLRGAGGCAVSIAGDFMAHGYPAEQMDQLALLGTRGAIHLRGDELVLSGTGRERVTLDLAANYRASYRDAIAHFVDRVRDGEPFETSPEVHLETLRIVEAAYRMSG